MKKKLLFFTTALMLILSTTDLSAQKVILDGEKLFPLIKWGGITCNSSLENKKIPLGFCTVDVVADDSLTRFIGKANDGTSWEIDLASTMVYEQCSIDVYVGDLCNNGMKDLVIRYSYPGASGVTAYGDSHLLFVLFDKNGYPHPRDFFVHIPSAEAPLKNLLQDSQGRAVLVHKRLERNGENLNMFCYASFYRAVNSKWEKILTTDLELKNPTLFSGFNMDKESKPFDSSDQAMEMCSGVEDNDAPDFGSFQVVPFKKMKSFRMEKNELAPRFQIVAQNADGKSKDFNVEGYESCYVVIEKNKDVKIINFVGTDVQNVMKEMVKKRLPVKIICVENSLNYFIYFAKDAGRMF